MKVDCGRCELRGTGCQDCVITALEPRNPAGSSVPGPGYLGEAEVKALSVLAAAGMVPPCGIRWPARPSCPARAPGHDGTSPTRERHDASVTIWFPRVKRGAATEQPGFTESVEAPFSLHYAGPNVARPGARAKDLGKRSMSRDILGVVGT